MTSARPQVLEVVDAPRVELPRVLDLAAAAARPERAREEAAVRVEAEPQTERVDRVDDGCHAVGERAGVRHEVAVRRELRLLPAVVDVQVAVPLGRETAAHEVARLRGCHGGRGGASAGVACGGSRRRRGADVRPLCGAAAGARPLREQFRGGLTGALTDERDRTSPTTRRGSDDPSRLRRLAAAPTTRRGADD